MDLATFLKPLKKTDFLNNYFNIKPLYIAGSKNKLRSLITFSETDAFEAMKKIDHNPGSVGSASISAYFSIDFFKIPFTQVKPLLESGASICVSGIHEVVPEINLLMNTLKYEIAFGGKVGAHCYISKSGGGADIHYDARVATTLQLEGTKTWRFSKNPAIAFPKANAALKKGQVHHVGSTLSEKLRPWERAVMPPRPSDLVEVTLKPGDILCLPAGTWHEAKAGDHSLALNLFFQPQGLWDTLRDALATQFIDLEHWRSGYLGDTRGELDRGIPPSFRSYFSRVRQDLLDWLKNEDQFISDQWLSLHNQLEVEPPAPPSKKPSTIKKSSNILVSDKIKKLRYFVSSNPGGKEKLVIICMNRHYELPLEAASILARLKSKKQFKALEMCAWSKGPEQWSWKSVKELIHVFTGLGILEAR